MAWTLGGGGDEKAVEKALEKAVALCDCFCSTNVF